MERRDTEYQLNQGDWDKLIASQSAIFTPQALVSLSRQLSSEFHHGRADGVPMPELDAAAMNTPDDWALAERIGGYDLPCLITGEVPSRGRIVLCAQDPLRSWQVTPGITVGCPFGVDVPKMRHQRKSNGLVWGVVRACVDSGYDVWLTDAWKLWLKGRKPQGFYDKMAQVLRAELKAVDADGVVALGRKAEHALQQFNVPDVVSLPHPALYHKKAWYFDGHTAAFQDTVEGRFEAKVAKYWGEIERHF